MRVSFLVAGAFAAVVSKNHPAGGCVERAFAPPPQGRIGVVGHAEPWLQGVRIDEVGVGTPADGRLEPGEVVRAIDGVPLTGCHAFGELRRRARGEPGTPVELLVEDDHGTRTVVIERAVFPDTVPRRVGRLPSADELLTVVERYGLDACVDGPLGRIDGTVRRGRLTIERRLGADDACLEPPAFVEELADVHADFSWTHPDALDSAHPVTVYPPGTW